MPMKDYLAAHKNEPTSNSPTPSPSLTTIPASENAWIDAAPLLGELNGHLTPCRIRTAAKETMDMRS